MNTISLSSAEEAVASPVPNVLQCFMMPRWQVGIAKRESSHKAQFELCVCMCYLFTLSTPFDLTEVLLKSLKWPDWAAPV